MTIDFSGVFIERMRSVRQYEILWMTPDAHYYTMLGRFMALADPVLAPALMDYACRFEFDYDDSPTITVKGEILADTLHALDRHAEEVARAATRLWPQVVALFAECIPGLRIDELTGEADALTAMLPEGNPH